MLWISAQGVDNVVAGEVFDDLNSHASGRSGNDRNLLLHDQPFV